MVDVKLDIISASVTVLGIVAAFVRHEYMVRHHAKEIESIKAKHDKDIADLKSKHEQGILAQFEREKAIWEKFETVHASLMTISGQLGRVEGKIDAK